MRESVIGCKIVQNVEDEGVIFAQSETLFIKIIVPIRLERLMLRASQKPLLFIIECICDSSKGVLYQLWSLLSLVSLYSNAVQFGIICLYCLMVYWGKWYFGHKKLGHSCHGHTLKPNALDICIHIPAANGDANGDVQIQFVNHSEVKFVCVKIQYVSKPLISLKESMDISLAHTQWRAVIGLCCKQSLYATTLLHVRLEFWHVHFVRTYTPM